MHEVVLGVMLIAAALYAVLGGADFGAGLIEPFVAAEERHRIDAALAPVWEANHVWLVLLATLSFVAFPPLYALTLTYLHIPVLLVLLGIVARGSAFTFRHYDPTPGAYGGWYTLMFRGGSLLTPMFLGITLAATAYGGLRTDVEAGFYALYVAPWNTWFGWTTGAFVCALFAFEGAALLAAENARTQRSLPYETIARRAHLLSIVLGALVLLVAYFDNHVFFARLVASPVALACLVVATLLVPAIAHGFRHGRPWLVRGATFVQVCSILVGFFVAQLPTLLRLSSGDLTIERAAAPDATFRSLSWAIAIGLSAILPGTAYLIRVYKRGPASPPPSR